MANEAPHDIRFIDSHTGGEPTRTIVAGGPDLGTGSIREKRDRFRLQADDFRRAVILEPRGHEAVVGALLCPPTDSRFATGVIFFNNCGYLGMCGHGAIGVAVTLYYLQRVDLGGILLETPVGEVAVNLLTPHRASVSNVPSYRYRADVSVQVAEWGTVTGDIAWGGNWFFLVDETPAPLELRHVDELSDAARRIREALRREGITGEHGAEIDHIEFFGAGSSHEVHSRNFVYCPGGAYDRSPCGTGTSAKLACLAARGKLQPGELWVQESLIGSRFQAAYEPLSDGRILPTITGEAYVCAEGRLVRQPNDPFRDGIDGEVAP